MGNSLTMEDVIKDSLLAERDAEAFYREAENITNNERAKGIFNQLAKDEAGHFSLLKKRYLALKVAKPEDIQKIKDMPISDNMAKLKEAVDNNTGERAALEMAMQAELNAVKRYEHGVEIAEADDVKKMFEKLVDDEKRHHVILSEEFSILTGQPVSSEVDTFVRE